MPLRNPGLAWVGNNALPVEKTLTAARQWDPQLTLPGTGSNPTDGRSPRLPWGSVFSSAGRGTADTAVERAASTKLITTGAHRLKASNGRSA